MTKPTIDDFINNPSNAVRKGYKPDFISVGILAASAFGIDGFISIKESFISVMYGKVIEFPKTLICFFFKHIFGFIDANLFTFLVGGRLLSLACLL